MIFDTEPVVGNWYKALDSDRQFEVIAVDEYEGTVAIQYAEGELRQLTLDGWYEMEVEPGDADERWAATVHDVEEDGPSDLEEPADED